MKHLILLLTFLLSTGLFGQTNLISLRSHAGNPSELSNEDDNFGLKYMPRRVVEKVQFIKPGVIVEYSFEGSRFEVESDEKNPSIDTLYGTEYNKILTPSVKSRYPEKTVFIGFEMENKAAAPFFKNMHQNSVSWIFAFFILLGSTYYLIFKKSIN